MAEIKAAEGPRKPKSQKVLAEIRLKRGLDGGVVATHHYEGYEHEPAPHNLQDHEVMGHLQEHMGLEHEEPAEE